MCATQAKKDNIPTYSSINSSIPRVCENIPHAQASSANFGDTLLRGIRAILSRNSRCFRSATTFWSRTHENPLIGWHMACDILDASASLLLLGFAP